jgi:hypothetical protein
MVVRLAAAFTSWSIATASLSLVTAGCHVTTRVEVTRVAATTLVPRDEPPRPLPATAVVDDQGRLRFVEPLQCRSDVVVELETTEVVRVRPNLAAFVVAITASSLGAVATFLGSTDDEPASSPLTYGGVALIAVGAPFLVGPWFGNRVEHRDAGTRTASRGTRDRACGERAAAAVRATLSTASLRATGDVDDDGVFSVSPFALVDAFDRSPRPLAARVDLVTATGTARLDAVLEPAALARGRAAFLRGAGVDATIEPLRKVPTLSAGAVRIGRRIAAGRSTLRIGLAVANAGPGDAFAVRGRIVTRHPEVDGRLLYFGRIPARASVSRELLVTISDGAARDLEGADIELAIELRDAHDTAPDQPVRFRGKISQDAGP